MGALTVVLVTDVEASTDLRRRLGESAADALQVDLLSISTSQVEANGGTVVKTMGDGLLATFGGAADAVAASIAIQQRVTAAHAVRLRVGISAGDVGRDGEDVLGLPVVDAARLCAAADGGQVLAAELVRLLARGRAGDVFRTVGSVELKGLAEPIDSDEVVWEPLRQSGAAPTKRPAFPAALKPTHSTPLLGRNEELAAIRFAWRFVRAGGRRAVVVTGPPGIGKTRVAEEAAGLIAEDRGVVLHAVCEEGDKELGPLVDALRPTGIRDEHATADRAIEALTAFTAPVLLVVDDLHWASEAVLEVLRRLLAAEGLSLLVVAATDGPVPQLVADQAVLVLEPWTREEMTAAAVFALGRHARDELELAFLEAVVSSSDGSPLHFMHLLRYVRDSGAVRLEEGGYRALGTLPELPTDATTTMVHRICQLPGAGASVLSQAANQGMEFDLAPLAGTGVPEVLDAAEDARLVSPHPERLDRYRFTHALVREAALRLATIG